MKSSAENTTLTAPFKFDHEQRKCAVRDANELPDGIFEIADDIEILDASFGNLRFLPDNLGELTNLRVAFFSNNTFDEIPKVLATCPKLEMVGFKSCGINKFDTAALPSGLRGLILTDNRLSEVPQDISSLTQLQKLMLTGNNLRSLPRTLLDCQNLELLRVALNELNESPDWLFKLPSLAWYSDSANKFRQDEQSLLNDIRKIKWADLEIQYKVGQSAKNEVYRAELDGKQVAVKLFGEGVTTDGAPIDDMNASLIAGDHSSIIGGIGQVVGHPSGQEGYVMPYIPPDYTTLGNPPDFKTLTRDTFADERFAPDKISRILHDVASAMGHLAAKGIMHGDLYAHNILTDSTGHSYLGDFGAASLYEPNSKLGLLREQIDIRGFGYLIDDLSAGSSSEFPNDLNNLREHCLKQDPDSRPTFKEIISVLK